MRDSFDLGAIPARDAFGYVAAIGIGGAAALYYLMVVRIVPWLIIGMIVLSIFRLRGAVKDAKERRAFDEYFEPDDPQA